MSRRMRVPATDELFRPTVVPDDNDAGFEAVPAVTAQPPETVASLPAQPSDHQAEGRNSSGRVRHDEKMTVYVTANELFDIEHARLELRRSHGRAVDRGRLVRAAVAMALADLDLRGADSELVRRLDEG